MMINAMQRVNLDKFWIRERSTVSNTLSNAKKTLKMSREVGLKGMLVSWGLAPGWNYCGHELAIEMALASRKSGRHGSSHVQFQTMYHIPS